jgi:multimeric flavodoxin WrbA
MENQIPQTLQFSHHQRYIKLDPGSAKDIVIIQASPRKEGVSKTEMVAMAFAEGCRKAGAQVETINLRDKKIRHCQGCFQCWSKTPGQCMHKDDAAGITERAEAADVVVYAAPLYHFGIISLLKKYIERTLPVMEPFLVRRDDGETTHPPRKGRKASQNVVVIGVCGFPEASHFGAFSANFHYLANAGGDYGMNIVTEIYRPLSEILGNPFMKEENDRVLQAVGKAGVSLVEKGWVPPSLIDEIAEVRLDKDEVYKAANRSWEICIEEGITMPELQQKLAGM